MKSGLKEKYIYWIFEYSLLIKAINSVWETVLGIFLLTDSHFRNSVLLFAKNELGENPHNLIARYIQNFITHLSHGTIVFISTYLLGQGIIKILLIMGITKKQLWAYQTAMYAFFTFTFYQIYRFNHTHSILLIILSVFDIITILLIEHEYGRVKKHLPDY